MDLLEIVLSITFTVNHQGQHASENTKQALRLLDEVKVLNIEHLSSQQH